MQLSTNHLLRFCLFVGITLAVVSCKDSDDFFSSNNAKENETVDTNGANSFDFSTSQEVDLVVDYSDFKICGPVWFSVYSVNPYVNEMKHNEYINENIKPLFQGYTDEKGKFDATITLPAYAKVLHVVTGNFLVSDRRILAQINNGQAVAIAEDKGVKTRAKSMRVAGAGTSTNDLSGMKHLYCKGSTQIYKPWYTALGTWNSASGRPDYLLNPNDPEAISKGLVFSEEDVNGMFATACDALNSGTNLKESYRAASDLTVVRESEISITALGSSTCWNSSLGYYYYTGDAPTNKMDLNIIMLFPNTQDGQWPRGNYPNNDYRGNIGTVRGDVIQLMYYPVNADGSLDIAHGTTMFPAGTKIGFILKTNAWGQRGADYAVNGSYKQAKNIWASSTDGLSSALDTGVKFGNPDGEARSAKFSYTDSKGNSNVVVSFEDACDDKDYDDLMFGLNPANAFDMGDVAKIESRKAITESVFGFEDVWPAKGDYDLNDVMIDCRHELEYYTHADGSNKLNKEYIYLTTYQNYVERKSGLAVDLQVSDLATVYVNKLKPGQTKYESTDYKAYNKMYYYLPEFGWSKDESRMWYLTDDVKRDLGTTYVFEVTYTKAVNKSQATVRPFLYRAESGGKQWEVHLPWTEPTKKMNMSYFGTVNDKSNPSVVKKNGQKMYYVSGDEYPFAFCLEGVTIDAFKETTLKRENESKPIDTFFPGFIEWSKSGGKSNLDWYTLFQTN